MKYQYCRIFLIKFTDVSLAFYEIFYTFIKGLLSFSRKCFIQYTKTLRLLQSVILFLSAPNVTESISVGNILLGMRYKLFTIKHSFPEQ